MMMDNGISLADIAAVTRNDEMNGMKEESNYAWFDKIWYEIHLSFIHISFIHLSVNW